MIEHSQEEAREAFEARPVIERGLIRCTADVNKTDIKGSDIALRSFLLADFHVCLAECLGNSLLADTLRDFTARTTLIAMLYQSSQDAAQSCDEHVRIVEALEAGDLARAENLMQSHVDNVQSTLKLQPTADDPLAQLRSALTPIKRSAARPKPERAQGLHTRSSKPARTAPTPHLSTDSTYLGALL